MIYAKDIESLLADYETYLHQEEKSKATIEKYMRDAHAFLDYMHGRSISKEETLGYKEYLTEKYAPASANSMIVALNCLLRFAGLERFCVKPLKIQRQLFCSEEKELTQSEYKRLLKAAEGTRLEYVIRTICSIGIRVSELEYITVEAVRAGRAVVNCKNKTRVIFIPVSVQKFLLKYIKKVGIKSGCVFVSRNGKPLNRSNIWRDMKALCKIAAVSPNKVFPHNLRHLFARTFYSIERDIIRLADLLGHSNVNTTRIYTAETGNRHFMLLEKVQKKLMT